MAGTTNNGVVGYISNPVASFPANSITVDIFGNTFYRDYSFGAGDDTGVYWNTKIVYSESQMLFLASMIKRYLQGKYDFGHKLRSSQSYDFKISLPTTSNNEIDFDFMESFIRELEEERIRELSAYLTVSGLADTTLTASEEAALQAFDNLDWKEFNVCNEIFNVKNTHNILSSEIRENSGSTPYLCASAENNGVSSYISYDTNLQEKGNCIFIGGKTFVVSYQENDFFSNDSHNLALYLKNAKAEKSNQLYLATCIRKSLGHKYTWGDSISKTKIKEDNITLPVKSGKPDYAIMGTFISAVQKLVIKDVVQYADNKIEAAKIIVK